jgi:hypothetical protein
MMKKMTLMLFAFLALPMVAFAGDCCPSDTMKMDGMEHHAGMKMDDMKMDSMHMSGNEVMLGHQEISGVTAMAHLKDVRQAMSEAGMTTTHHFMVMLHDQATDASLDQGSVAVKVTLPTGQQLPATKLMGMQGHFGADVTLATPGEYTFTVGSVLADGQKRVFTFKTVLPE